MWRDGVRIPSGVVSFRPRVRGIALESGAMTEAAALPLHEIKAVQQRAFDRGREVGRADAAKRLGDLLVSLERLVGELSDERTKERAALAQFGIELGVGLAKELVGATLAIEGHDIRRLVDGALEQALPSAAGAAVTLRLHPDDLVRLEAGLSTHPFGSGIPVQLVADGALSRGAVKVFSGGAEVDADVRKRLDSMLSALRIKAESTHA